MHCQVHKSLHLSHACEQQTIRLAVNYAKNQRAVLRVSPYVPMEQLLPEICAKCGLDARHSELFRSSSQSDHLDPAYSMAQHGIREVYVLDHSKSNLPEVCLVNGPIIICSRYEASALY